MKYYEIKGRHKFVIKLLGHCGTRRKKKGVGSEKDHRKITVDLSL